MLATNPPHGISPLERFTLWPGPHSVSPYLLNQSCNFTDEERSDKVAASLRNSPGYTGSVIYEETKIYYSVLVFYVFTFFFFATLNNKFSCQTPAVETVHI